MFEGPERRGLREVLMETRRLQCGLVGVKKARALVVFMLLSVGVGGAATAQSVGSPSVTPVAVYVQEPTLIRVVSRVAADPALIANSVTLLRLNASGQGGANLGRMYDDGSHGDATAGDGIFTAEVSVVEPSTGTVAFAVTAAYRGQLLRVRSSPGLLPVVTRVSDAERQQVITVQSAGATLFNSRRAVVGDQSALIELVNFLRGRQGVQDVLVSSDNTSVNVVFTSGLQGVIATGPVNTRGSGSRTAKTLIPARSSTHLVGKPGVRLASPQASSTVPYPGKSTALVLQPFFSQPGVLTPDESPLIASDLSRTCGGQTTPLADGQVTVNIMKTLTHYGVISIASHGVLVRPSASDLNGPNEYVVIWTGEQVVASPSADLQLLQTAQFIMPGSPESAPNTQYWVITPRFLDTYAAFDGYSDSVVYLGICDGLINTSVSDMFLLHGAAAVLGYDTPVESDVAFTMGSGFFSALTDATVEPALRTVSAAYTAANPVPTFNLDTLPTSRDVALCIPPVVHMNPFGTHNISDGPFNLEVITQQLTPVAAPADITVVVRREVISACRGILFSSNREIVVPQGQTSVGGIDAAGRDPVCNTLPITTRWTILQAIQAPSISLDLSVVPSPQLSVSIVR
jgi:hypothetical protein